MGNHYYYFISGLPSIMLDEAKLSISLLNFRKEVREHVHPTDYEYVKYLFLKHDNSNLINFLFNKDSYSFDEFGNFTEEKLAEGVLTKGILYEYMDDFIEKYNNDTSSNKSKVYWEKYLTKLFYDFVLKNKNEYIRKWFEFEMNVKNIIIGINCRKFGISPNDEVIGDNFVANNIRKSNAEDFGLSKEVEYMGKLLHILEIKNFIEREKAIDNLKWEYAENLAFFHYFTIEKILSYIIKMSIAERWLKLDKEAGIQILQKLVKDMEMEFEFSDVFTLDGGKNI